MVQIQNDRPAPYADAPCGEISYSARNRATTSCVGQTNHTEHPMQNVLPSLACVMLLLLATPASALGSQAAAAISQHGPIIDAQYYPHHHHRVCYWHHHHRVCSWR
jgi:hypothetical protein